LHVISPYSYRLARMLTVTNDKGTNKGGSRQFAKVRRLKIGHDSVAERFFIFPAGDEIGRGNKIVRRSLPIYLDPHRTAPIFSKRHELIPATQWTFFRITFGVEVIKVKETDPPSVRT
jgi:hypothetical protein